MRSKLDCNNCRNEKSAPAAFFIPIANYPPRKRQNKVALRGG